MHKLFLGQTQDRSVRMNFRLLKTVLIENKELVIAPAFTLIPQLFSLPFFLASLILKCQNFNNNNLRYLLILSYFIKFVPQLTSFWLYISPSSLYCTQWERTRLSNWIKKFRRTDHLVTSISKTTHINTKVK